jgi:hypothetical protein
MAQATATIGIKSAAFKRGLDEMRSEAKAWGGELKSTIAGAFAFGAVAEFVGSFMTEMDRIAKISARFGQSTEAIQRLGHVASLAGSDLEMVAKVMTKLTIEAGRSSEQFDALGISASAFAGAGFDDQILMLADAYEAANGDVQKQVALMTLLGTKGQDILPLLATGAAELRKQFEGVSTTSAGVIKSIEFMNDSWDDFGQSGKAALGAVFGYLIHFKAQLLAVYQLMTVGGTFNDNYLKNIEPMLDQTPTGGNTKKPLRDTQEDQKKTEDSKKSAADGVKALDEEMLKLARSRMNAEQKITDLKREQAQHIAAAKDKSNSETDRLASTKKVLEIQQQIEAGEADAANKKKEFTNEEEKQRMAKLGPEERLAELKKKQNTLYSAAALDPSAEGADAKKLEALRLNDEIARAQGEIDRKKADGSKAEGNLADEKNKQKLEKMNPLDRIRELKRQQKEINDAADKDPDRKSKAEKKLEALKINDDIDAAHKEMTDKKGGGNKSSVISSSLASIGGGGRAYIGGDPALAESRRHTGLLQQLVRNTAPQGGSFGAPSKANPF